MERARIEEAAHSSFEKLKEPYAKSLQKKIDDAISNGTLSDKETIAILLAQNIIFSANLVIESLSILFPEAPE